MKIKYSHTIKVTKFSDYFNIYYGPEADEGDAFIAIVLFGREFCWEIHK